MSLLMRLPTRRGSQGRRPEHPDDEDVRELARETYEEEGVRGRQAEYPDQGVDTRTHVMGHGVGFCFSEARYEDETI